MIIMSDCSSATAVCLSSPSCARLHLLRQLDFLPSIFPRCSTLKVKSLDLFALFSYVSCDNSDAEHNRSA